VHPRRRLRARQDDRARRRRRGHPEDQLQGQPHGVHGTRRLQRDRRQSERGAGHGADPRPEAGRRVAPGPGRAEVRLPEAQGLAPPPRASPARASSRPSMDLTLIAQSLLNGLLGGGVYSLTAVGLTLIFGVMRIVNFAHGEMMVWGMY